MPDLQKELDRYLTVLEVCASLHLSNPAVIALFESEPDVLVLGNAITARGKRRYRTLRIPLSAYNRKVRQLANRKAAR